MLKPLPDFAIANISTGELNAFVKKVAKGCKIPDTDPETVVKMVNRGTLTANLVDNRFMLIGSCEVVITKEKYRIFGINFLKDFKENYGHHFGVYSGRIKDGRHEFSHMSEPPPPNENPYIVKMWVINDHRVTLDDCHRFMEGEGALSVGVYGLALGYEEGIIKSLLSSNLLNESNDKIVEVISLNSVSTTDDTVPIMIGLNRPCESRSFSLGRFSGRFRSDTQVYIIGFCMR